MTVRGTGLFESHVTQTKPAGLSYYAAIHGLPAKPRSRDLFFCLSAGHDHHTTLCLPSPNISHYTTYPYHQLARVSGYYDIIFRDLFLTSSSLGVLSLCATLSAYLYSSYRRYWFSFWVLFVSLLESERGLSHTTRGRIALIPLVSLTGLILVCIEVAQPVSPSRFQFFLLFFSCGRDDRFAVYFLPDRS